MPTLSIIIPVYNVVHYVAQCLDSILIDNHFEGEVICVNDGSTDDSLLVLRDYATRYSNIVIIDQDNKGLSEARNAGLRVATGDYVAFIDSDDWLFPNTLDRVLQHIDGEEVLYYNARKVYEDTGLMDGDKDILERKHLSGPAYFAAIQGEPRNMPCVCVCGGIYLREFLLKNNLYNEPGIYHEDSYFTPQVLMTAKDVSCINVYVYAYRVRTSGSITSSIRPKHIKDMLFIARNLYGQITDSKQSENVFRQYIADLYTNIITRSYESNLPLSRWWCIRDSYYYTQCAMDSARTLKSARLAMIHTRLAYMYLEDRLPHIVRRFVNKYL